MCVCVCVCVLCVCVCVCVLCVYCVCIVCFVCVCVCCVCACKQFFSSFFRAKSKRRSRRWMSRASNTGVSRFANTGCVGVFPPPNIKACVFYRATPSRPARSLKRRRLRAAKRKTRFVVSFSFFSLSVPLSVPLCPSLSLSLSLSPTFRYLFIERHHALLFS